MDIVEQISKGRVIPVVALSKAEQAVPLCRALQAGGLEVAEITFRTDAAEESIRLVSREFPSFALGAGTVLDIEELERAKEAGARFAVSPGLNPKIVERANALSLPFFPGVCTPTEVTMALELGCRILKFFPAEAAGGVKTLKSMAAPFAHRGVRFIPTGGIDAANAEQYLKLPSVVAVGGSWLVEKSLLEAGAWSKVTELAREAVG